MSRQFMQGFFVAALLSALAGFSLAQTGVNPYSATLTTLVNFGNGNGQYPEAGLAQGLDGNFYGTTYYGAADSSEGIAYNITPAGILTTFGYPCTTNSSPLTRITLRTAKRCTWQDTRSSQKSVSRGGLSPKRTS